MKKKNFILALSVTTVALLSTGVIVSAVATSSNNEEYYSEDGRQLFENFTRDSKLDAEKARLAEKSKKAKTVNLYAESESKTDLGLDEMNAKYEAEEEESKKNDLKAYEILSKYKGSKYARTTFITDYELDLTYMREMVTLIESNTLPKDEADVLHRYVSRRAYWITDENTAKEFEKWMLG